MFKHILIPTDGSELTRKAILSGIALAKAIHVKAN
jgi:nucleotide-binding universal stress UspA family protein